MTPSRDPRDIAQERILAIARALDANASDYGLPQEFMTKLRAALLTDPLIPRKNPSISLWQEPPHPTVSSIQSKTLPRFTDIVIIGSGITGCSVAKSLLDNPTPDGDSPSRIVVLEARTLVSGATGRNGGHLVTPVGHLYSTLARRYGEETAKEMSHFSLLNIDRVMGMVREMDPDLQADSEMRDLLKVMVAGDPETWKASVESLAEFRKAVPEYKTLHRVVEKEDVPHILNIKNGEGAIEHAAGAVWPYRLITGIFQRLLAQYPDRLSIETNTPATNIEYQDISSTSSDVESKYPYKIETPRGIIRTKQVVHCTNANAAHLLRPLIGKLYPYRGTMSVQKAGPLLENVGNDRSWSFLTKQELDPVTGFYKGGLFYLQQNGVTGDIWVGTDFSSLFEVLQSDDTSTPGHSVESLNAFLPNYFVKGWAEGERPEIKAAWTGLQGHTSDGLPLVGKLPTSVSGRAGDGEWIAAGYSGYGMDKAWMTGEALVSMLTGKGTPDWLPKAFLMTEKRLQNDLTTERSVAKWVAVVKDGDW